MGTRNGNQAKTGRFPCVLCFRCHLSGVLFPLNSATIAPNTQIKQEKLRMKALSKCLLLLPAAALCTAIYAQSYDPTSYLPVIQIQGSGGTGKITVLVTRDHDQRFPLVRNAPFSGRMHDARARTQDDTPRESGLSFLIWRDSEGRVRTERSADRNSSDNADDFPTVITICDQAAKSLYVLDTGQRVAHRYPCLPTLTPQEIAAAHPPQPGSRPRPSPPAEEPQRKVEKLPSQFFGDVAAEGSRMTVTIPMGYEGNDRPIVSVTEEWTSLELKLCVQRKSVSPSAGIFIREVVDLRRGEPDAALFQIPRDYAIVDEAGAFEFVLTRGKK